MSQETAGVVPVRRLTYSEARTITLGSSILGLAFTVVLMIRREFPAEEVLATVLMVPVVVSFLYAFVRGGVAGAAVATTIYALLLKPASDEWSWSGIVGILLFLHLVSYLLVGMVGGFTMEKLKYRLESIDKIDPLTGLANARFFVSETDIEISRARRHDGRFSVVVIDVPRKVLIALSRHAVKKAMKSMGKTVNDAVRTTDRVAYGDDGTRSRFALILPETSNDGALILSGRLTAELAAIIEPLGRITRPEELSQTVLTFPDDADELQSLHDDFALMAAVMGLGEADPDDPARRDGEPNHSHEAQPR